VEHPVLKNPQQARIEECRRALHATSPALKGQKASLSHLDSYLKNFVASDLSLLEDEYNRQKAQLLTKKTVLRSLTSLKRRAWSSLQGIEDKRLALGVRILNSYQLSEILSFLEPEHTHLVCHYWMDVATWDLKLGLAPETDYAEGCVGVHEEVTAAAVSIDDELNGIIENFVGNEIDALQLPLCGSHASTATLHDSRGDRDRQRGSLVGSVRSSVPSSGGSNRWVGGLLPLLKVLCMVSQQVVPLTPPLPPLRASSPQDLKPFLAGRLHSPSATSPLRNPSTAVIAINSMTAGGSSAHLLCSSGGLPRAPPSSSTSSSGAITRYLCGRTKLSIERYVQGQHLHAAAWTKHLRQSASVDTFPWRGLVHAEGQSAPSCEPVDLRSTPASQKRVAFCYAGHGTQWQELARQLWTSDDRFRTVLVEGCVGLPIDVENLFSMPSLSWMQLQMPEFGITLVQIGLTVLLQEAGVIPDVLVGHGLGEIACGFADGCTSAAEAIRIAFYRSQLAQSLELGGLMLNVHLDLESAVDFVKAYPNCVIACHNSPTEVTYSGLEGEIRQIAGALEAMGVQTRLLSTGEESYHSLLHTLHVDVIDKLMKDAVAGIHPRRRSSKWISTSCTSCLMGAPHHCRYPTASYEVHNICNVVDFASVLPKLSSDMFVFEIGSSELMGIFHQAAASGSSHEVVYQSVGGAEVSAVVLALADQLWLHGNPLTFARAPCLVPLADRLAVDWGEVRSVPGEREREREGSGSSLVMLPVPRVRSEVFGVEMLGGGGLESGPQLVPLRKNAATARGFAVHMSVCGDVSSLQWLENSCDPNCEVKFCGINAVDTRALSTAATCSEEGVEEGVRFGCEYSGVRDDGVAVMGLTPQGCLATHIHTSGHLLWPLPNFISLEEAATIPLDYCTAYFALVVKANIQPGQSVLIQDICTGVGQAAYHICRFRNCPVWAVCPAGRREWALEHIGGTEADCLFDSADDRVLRESIFACTQGAGVDVVVLVPGSEGASAGVPVEVMSRFGQLCVLAQSGGADEAAGVALPLLAGAARKQVSVHFVDALPMIRGCPALCSQLHVLLEEGLLSGEVVPKHYRLFDQVERALVAERDHEHCGLKRLVYMGDATRLFAGGEGDSGGGGKEKVSRVLRTEGVHVIIGGRNRDSSRTLASFLLRQGAAQVCVVLAEGSETEAAGLSDTRISTVSCDLTSSAACEQVILAAGAPMPFVGLWCVDPLPSAQSDPPSDSNPDADADAVAENWLHSVDQCTRDLPSVELFVVLSSCGGEDGGVRAGYQWAAEAVCQERRDRGLPAVAVQVRGEEGGEVVSRVVVEHIGDIVCSENTVVVVL
jgi:NADPH:quinone reductase-like Zn-dependent oxidoreductase